jgi:hypothetical protein
MKTNQTPYSDNFDALIALVTHLSSTPRKSRRIPRLAHDLGLSEDQVRAVLEGFKGLFRKSHTTDEAGQHFYTVQLRFARRGLEGGEEGENSVNEPLSSSELSSLIDLILEMVSREQERSNLLAEQQNQLWRLSQDIEARARVQQIATLGTLVAAVIAALAAIAAAGLHVR